MSIEAVTATNAPDTIYLYRPEVVTFDFYPLFRNDSKVITYRLSDILRVTLHDVTLYIACRDRRNYEHTFRSSSAKAAREAHRRILEALGDNYYG